MKQNLIILLIISIGIIGTAGVWNYRYQLGNNQGYLTGVIDGNNTGYLIGDETGTDSGYNDGYNEGFDLGKDVGYIEGYPLGFKTGSEEGHIEGYSDGYSEGESLGLYEGYYAGIEHRSKSSTLRDPTHKEALRFIEIDDTDELYQSNKTLTYDFFVSRIRQNAAAEGFRCIWVQVEMYDKDTYFCAFNTTDSGMLYFNYRFDNIHELEVGKPCYDDRYIEPEYDDTITKIIHIY